jgi:hypothetical protein
MQLPTINPAATAKKMPSPLPIRAIFPDFRFEGGFNLLLAQKT